MSIPPLPRWLADEPQIHALLDAVLDRFDRQSGEDRQQKLVFPAEEYLPSLQRLDEASDLQWSLVLQLKNLSILTTRLAKRGPYDPEWKGAKLAFAPQAEAALRSWLKRPRQDSDLQHWRMTLKQYASRFPDGIEPLFNRRIEVPGWSDERVIQAFASMAEIEEPHTLRQIACRTFAGDSKRLDSREELVQNLFPELKIKPRALVITVHLPQSCQGILFIENQDTYAEAMHGSLPETKDLALVYASGFRGGAERIRDPQAALLHYSGSLSDKARFESWWSDQTAPQFGPLYFFGDLDYAGMAILSALRSRFGNVHAWKPGYSVLVDYLRDRQGHDPATFAKKQSDPITTGCDYADSVLLPAIRQHGFIDQEILG